MTEPQDTAATSASENVESVIVDVAVMITSDELDKGWNGDVEEFEASVRATLHELIGDDGGAYVPHVTTYTERVEVKQ